jgi:hypothetical protein
MKAPGKEHWEPAMRVFWNLMKTTHCNIWLGGLCAILYAYGDANLAGDSGGKMDTHRSMSGSVYFLGNGPIEWGASTQKRVALSTSAAEATAMRLLIGSYSETAICLSHSTTGLAFLNKFSSHHWTAMLDKWGDTLAAARHATNSFREEHSVSKGYGAQTRKQHNKAIVQKALSICGKRLFHLHGDSQALRSEFNESCRSLNGSGD